ncbi:DNA-binding CsgD family transcriptional regulator [Kitasatospora herbaricolor]|uniref:helix-turn-helix transcriptional regulator n=1 Tax=Kitasatospora herbaricolor TaxID=68217 RepID=UPI001E3E0AB6|nr:AAA family ATPase [Kitasatospora herbaricolor]MDQ0305644.1 DNA-binding CsgD family transcriptional regulator [Kitasatospora herbaricolor]
MSEIQGAAGAVVPVVPDDVPGTRRVVLFGPPGIGKTTTAGVLGRRLGLPVLRLAPGPQDARISWTGLLELALALQPLPAAGELAAALDEAAGRPGPPDGAGPALRLRRLTTALLREAPPLTLVVDNAQWLDAASAAVLRWALRLVPDLPVIVAERTWRPGAEGHWSGEDAHVVRVPSLAHHQIAALLALYRPTAREVTRIHACSGGNPALALALADDRGRTADGPTAQGPEDDPVLPPAARRLVGEWLSTVSGEVQELLTFAALDDRPDRRLLGRLAGPAAEHLLTEAEAAGLIDTDQPDGTVRFTASAIGAELTARLPDTARRLLHARLAEASHDGLRRDRHTALASDADDPRIAQHAARAAVSARRRGEHALAAELSLFAAQRTPPQDTALLTERALTAARDAAHYGDLARGRTAARLVLQHDSSPAQRVDTLIALIDASGQHLDDADHLFADALHTAAGHPDLTAQILIRRSLWANVNEGDPQRACDLAEQAATLSEAAGDTATTAMALTLQARFQRILGHPGTGTTLARALFLPRNPLTPVNGTPQHLAARHTLFDDRPDQARTLLLPLLVEAERTADAEATVDILRSLAEAELRAGRCTRALDHAHRAQILTDRTSLSPAPACYTSALVEGAARNTDTALAHARRGIDTARHEDNKVFLSRNLFALGHLLMTTGHPKEALDALEEVRALEERQQVRDPSLLRWHPELAETLTAHGRLDEAQDLLDDTRRTATELGRTSVLPGLDRAQALLEAARGDYDTAAHRLGEAADHLHHLPLDRGRTLLALSHTERRARRRASARTAAQSAADLFTTHQAHPWAEAAARTLRRLDTLPADNRARPHLTGAEQRCAELAAAGASNRDIAAALTVSVKTVEATLTRVYRKLGLHSRVQLPHTVTPARE